MFAMAQEHARNAAEAVIYAMLIRLLGQRSRRAVRLLASCAMELANASNAMGLVWWKSESVITVSVSRCLFESATPFRLKIVQITSERCRTLGQVYSHLSEEERQIIQIEIGNGTSIRRIAGLIGRHASTVSYEIKRNTWFPSSENESYRPYRPERLKTGPWTGRYYIAGPAHRKAGRRRIRTRKPYRLASDRLWAWVAERLRRGLVAAAGQRLAEAGASRRRVDALLPGDPVPVGLRRRGETGLDWQQRVGQFLRGRVLVR